ncbi:MAG: N-formylglutamate amidohydrolase [Proteobacteria bacterium]|nr:N-formylglutamate amidohydrolase [Pseudomonadota bacterium]
MTQNSSLMLKLEQGLEPAAPLLLDSPHSGRFYPDDFRFICPQAWLRQTEDALVDELFASAPKQGITFLHALFARSYIDPNRAENDIDPRMLDGAWPAPLAPTERSLAGHGLIRHLCRGAPVYAGKLSIEEVKRRIETCYRPYHATLEKSLGELKNHFGTVWHINCHSMPSALHHTAALTPLHPQADFILGDRDGSSCEKVFTAFAAQTLRALGYCVALNDPYKGVEVIARYGKPGQGVHSLQLEVNRALYMDEKTLQPSAGFEKLRHSLEHLISELRGWVIQRAGLQRLAAE